MKRIEKGGTPQCLQDFIDAQLGIEPEPVNLSYAYIRDKPTLLAILTSEQQGLCGYTGAAVDDRIPNLQVRNSDVRFSNHIEHLKCQQTCRGEVAARGEEYGRVIGDDLEYRNMIAALEVRGAGVEQFGAVKKANRLLPVLPIHEGCFDCFAFYEGDGGVEGLNANARTSVEVLSLDHDTLKGWRLSAITAWLDPDVVTTNEDLDNVLLAVSEAVDDRLPEFAFVIESIVRRYLNDADL